MKQAPGHRVVHSIIDARAAATDIHFLQLHPFQARYRSQESAWLRAPALCMAKVTRILISRPYLHYSNIAVQVNASQEFRHIAPQHFEWRPAVVLLDPPARRFYQLTRLDARGAGRLTGAAAGAKVDVPHKTAAQGQPPALYLGHLVDAAARQREITRVATRP